MVVVLVIQVVLDIFSMVSKTLLVVDAINPLDVFTDMVLKVVLDGASRISDTLLVIANVVIGTMRLEDVVVMIGTSVLPSMDARLSLARPLAVALLADKFMFEGALAAASTNTSGAKEELATPLVSFNSAGDTVRVVVIDIDVDVVCVVCVVLVVVVVTAFRITMLTDPLLLSSVALPTAKSGVPSPLTSPRPPKACGIRRLLRCEIERAVFADPSEFNMIAKIVTPFPFPRFMKPTRASGIWSPSKSPGLVKLWPKFAPGHNENGRPPATDDIFF